MGKLSPRGVMKPPLFALSPVNSRVQVPSALEGTLQTQVQFMPGPFCEAIRTPEFGLLRAQLLTAGTDGWDPKDSRTELQVLTDFLRGATKSYVSNLPLDRALTCAKDAGSGNAISEKDFNLLKEHVRQALENDPESTNLQFANAMLSHIASRQAAIMR